MVSWPKMRTTLTLDPDVAALLKKAVARGEVTFKQAVNDALRRGLTEARAHDAEEAMGSESGASRRFVIDVTDNAAIQEMWDREDYSDLHRRQPPPVRDKP